MTPHKMLIFHFYTFLGYYWVSLHSESFSLSREEFTPPVTVELTWNSTDIICLAVGTTATFYPGICDK